MFSFSSALDALERGQKVVRTSWDFPDICYIALHYPDEHSKMKLKYLYRKDPNGNLCPWQPSQTDLFAKDWNYYSGGNGD